MQTEKLIATIQKHQREFHPVVAFNPLIDKLLPVDFTETNKELTPELLGDAVMFTNYIHHKLQAAGCLLGIGGYAEHRTVYSRSNIFDADKPGEEPRRLHLATDIWGKAGTKVYAPLGGMIHSFAYNNRFGDYGATIILLHQLDGIPFYTLYGHISLKDIKNLKEGSYVSRGQVIAHFGEPDENGQWPPHLHFQVIIDLQMRKGDYPGVCKYSEKALYLDNCPDPDLILQMNQYLQ
ncbi:MAG TPA: peptidoglycan DD-metalloendopeptidase family protein [Chitinophagaceae bacterium]|nr:peptidoglycan DD-metalloendopeptidase family protein [Chitinophagaceae bacterium]